MQDFQIIDLVSLSSITGGADGGGAPNSDKLQVGAQATVPKLGPVNLGVNAERDRSDYGFCASTVAGMKGATPADIAKTCGLPPGGKQ